jgi:propanol-preferring alcohol dehydrogenase
MSEIPSFSYDLLWGERVLRSVANLTRQDGKEFMQLAPKVPVRTEVREFRHGASRTRTGDLRHASTSWWSDR